MRLRSEAGQAAALTAVFMTVLLGSCAAVLDVGAWFREDRDTQRIADAAALAGAQALPESTGDAQALALEYSDKNGGGLTPADITFSNTNMPNDTIRTEVERPAPGFFSRLFGMDSITVGSHAKARAGVPSEAKYVAPFAVDEKHPMLSGSGCPCFKSDTDLDLKKTGPGAFRVLNIDGSRGGIGSQDLEEWILHGYGGWMPAGPDTWYFSDPGAKFNSGNVQDALTVREGDELLFPVYRRTKSGGANFEYEVVGWVGFHVTHFDLRGESGKIFGHFTRVIWEGLLPENPSPAADFGVRTVSLID
jgi:Putative Flp pilus-assembly TadE/G-like